MASASDGVVGDDVMRDLLERLDISERLLSAQLVTIALDDSAGIDIEPQARSRQSDALTPAGLQDLISSIGVIGQLQPIIIEEHDDGRRVLLAGERRLSAMTQGAADAPDNPHFAAIRALQVPGPLSEWERRAVQLAENFARRDLTESDLGRALWYARCALFIERTRHLGQEPPEEVFAEGNPVDRWRVLNDWRASVEDLHNVGANWADTVSTLGVELSEDRADEIAKAFRDIGEGDSEVLDGLNASTRARKQVRAAKNEGLDDSVADLIEAVNELREGDESINPSRLLEEGAKRLRVAPDTDPRDIIQDVIREQVDREARKAAAAAEEDDLGNAAGAGSGGGGAGVGGGGDEGRGAEWDESKLEDAFRGSDFLADDEFGEPGAGPSGGGNGNGEGGQQNQSRLADISSTKTLKASQARRLIMLVQESATVIREEVLIDLEEAMKERLDLSDFDRNSMKLELEALHSAVESALDVLGKFGIAESA